MINVRQLLDDKQPEVWTIWPSASVYEALQLMAEKNVGALPVVEAGKLIGIFSERDYARKVILHGRSSRETRVEELMSSPVYWVDTHHTIESCMAQMTAKHIRHLPVLEDGKLVGMVSIGDIGKAIISQQQVTIKDLEGYITGRGYR